MTDVSKSLNVTFDTFLSARESSLERKIPFLFFAIITLRETFQPIVV